MAYKAVHHAQEVSLRTAAPLTTHTNVLFTTVSYI
jgi:hypothetical protein